MPDGIQARLQAYATNAFPDRQGVRVTDLTRIASGWESEIHSFDLEHGPAGERRREGLILRLYPGDDAERKSMREFHGMRKLREVGYPVPEVLILEQDLSPLGRPFVIMERIEGQGLTAAWMSAPPEKQVELLGLFCRLLAQLHALDWRPFLRDGSGHDAGDPYACVDGELEGRRARLARFPIAGFVPVMDWLAARRDQVPCPRPSPVHRDYHPENILLRDDGSAVVIDWTQFGVSDPRFDLGWTLLLASTHGDAGLRDPILHAYERHAGAAVEQLDYFEVFACLKRLLFVVASYTYGPAKVGMRPEALATMGTMAGPFTEVYALLQEKTGLRVPEAEGMLASLA